MEHLIRLVRAEIRGEKPYLIGGKTTDACKLNQNECPFDVPDDLKQPLLDAFGRISFNRYPAEQPFQLMRRLERLLERPENSVLVGNGSNDLTQTLALCFVSDGTRVVLPRPMFALFESVVRMHAGVVVSVAPLDNLQFDMQRVIREASDDSVALTIVASPNNPTGLAVSFADLKRLCEQAPGIVVVDEAYQEFNPEPSVIRLLDEYPNLIVMRTLSKAYGLAGLRIGYLVGHPSLMAEILKARIPFMVDRLSETAALTLLDHPGVIAERVEQARLGTAYLAAELESLEGVSVLRTTTNFILFKTTVDPQTMEARLSDQGVSVRSMASYPELRGFLRVSSGTDPENKAFVTAFKRVLKGAV